MLNDHGVLPPTPPNHSFWRARPHYFVICRVHNSRSRAGCISLASQLGAFVGEGGSSRQLRGGGATTTTFIARPWTLLGNRVNRL
ncbi:unnamed protein product [Lampetra fluviatilis]